MSGKTNVGLCDLASSKSMEAYEIMMITSPTAHLRAAGASTYKLKYGHRSHNQPVMNPGGTRCYITSQNHGFAIDETTLPSDWEPLFVNVNDGTNEGIRHKKKPFFSAQFHPEASSGPVDTEFLFDDFIKAMEASKK